MCFGRVASLKSDGNGKWLTASRCRHGGGMEIPTSQLSDCQGRKSTPPGGRRWLETEDWKNAHGVLVFSLFAVDAIVVSDTAARNTH